MKQYLFFDLDGTLTDSKPGIINSIRYSLKFFGITVDDPNFFTPFIGPPLIQSFKKYFNFSDETAESALERYREYYSEKGIYENAVYEGIPRLLQEQFDRGRKLVLATSKAEVYAKRILSRFEIDRYFTFIAGSELNNSRIEKEAVIRYALERTGVADLDEVIMIGDRKHDVAGAKAVGVPCIGVLFGYGDYDELSSAGADFIIDTVPALSLLLNKI